MSIRATIRDLQEDKGSIGGVDDIGALIIRIGFPLKGSIRATLRDL